MSKKKKIIYKTPQQMQAMEEGGKYLNELLILIASHAKPGVVLNDLEKIAEQYINQHKVKGAFKGYMGFPANLCLSLNSCLVHGIPDKTVLREGDLLKIDSGVIYKNMIVDAAVAKVIGGKNKNIKAQHMIEITKEALDIGIPTLQIGHSLLVYGQSVSKHLIQNGISIVESLTGHGVGAFVHEAPYVYNFAHKSMDSVILKPGMTLALEPITALGSRDYVQHPGNDWNLYTKGGDLGCQREYTVVVREDGVSIVAGVQDIDLICE